MFGNVFMLLIFYLYPSLAKVDLRQSASNKAFIDSLTVGEYEIVHPFQIRDKNERMGIDTRNYFLKAAEHHQHVTIVIRSTAMGRLKLVLERNNNIFLNQTTFRKLDSNGEHGLSSRVENCYYQGSIAGDANSFVALSSCNGLRGVLAYSNGSAYGIWPLDGGDRGRRHPHILYKTQWAKEAKCGIALAGAAQTAHLRTVRQHKLRHSRDASRQTKYVEIALIGDYEFTKNHGAVEEEALTYMLESVNIADLMLSRDLNIRLSVIYSEMWMDVQRIDLLEDIERTMAGVLEYATGHIYHIERDATIFFTGGSFSNHDSANSVFKGICTKRSAAIIKGPDNNAAQWTGQLLAQSVGHLMGLEHDTASCQCEMENNCVMSSTPGVPGSPFAWQFSKCSVARMHGVWSTGQVHCLLNRPFQVNQLRECGNGVVDGSEECDCGSREQCTDPCCDPLTCTLRAHAQCAAHHSCCHRCELRKQGEVCRSSKSSCDVAEVCDGKTGDCPADGHLVDGTTCGEDGQCWRGNCSDPQAQCKNLWGRDSHVADLTCFEQNSKGYEYANCGSGPDGIKACQVEDARCGTLHCEGGSASPMIGSLKAFTFQFSQNAKQIQCKSVADAPLALSADGSSCGSGRVCVAGSCVEMTSVSAPVACPSNNHALQCSGHGDCTTTALCVCFAGWSGEACDIRSNSTLRHRQDKKQVVVIPSIAMGKSLDTASLLGLLLLVGVFMLMLLVCLLFCYRRQSTIEIPTSSDEKLDESLPDQTQRSIKFGNMPSYREEKRKYKSNKHIFGALNRITEAEERDNASLRSRDSEVHSIASQSLFEPRTIPSSRSDVGVCSERGHDHIYADSVAGMGYRNTHMSPMRRRPTDGYGTDSETYGLRSFGSWREQTHITPEASPRHHVPSPFRLKLNNYDQMIKKVICDDDENVTTFTHPEPMSFNNDRSYVTKFRDHEEELSAHGTETDQDLGSNTESTRGYDIDANGKSSHDNSMSSPDQTKFDFRQSPSLFSDPFKLEMTTSIHT
ncbi:unnamed protein product [Auanema sp. JU1783]|nr:unnamed protein product [Auanema sp. JU1783]